MTPFFYICSQTCMYCFKTGLANSDVIRNLNQRLFSQSFHMMSSTSLFMSLEISILVCLFQTRAVNTSSAKHSAALV